MSTVTPNSDQLARRRAAERARAVGRARRADAGSVTEIARSLLRDAREAGEAPPRRGAGPAGRARPLRR